MARTISILLVILMIGVILSITASPNGEKNKPLKRLDDTRPGQSSKAGNSNRSPNGDKNKDVQRPRPNPGQFSKAGSSKASTTARMKNFDPNSVTINLARIAPKATKNTTPSPFGVKVGNNPDDLEIPDELLQEAAKNLDPLTFKVGSTCALSETHFGFCKYGRDCKSFKDIVKTYEDGFNAYSNKLIRYRYNTCGGPPRVLTLAQLYDVLICCESPHDLH